MQISGVSGESDGIPMIRLFSHSLFSSSTNRPHLTFSLLFFLFVCQDDHLSLRAMIAETIVATEVAMTAAATLSRCNSSVQGRGAGGRFLCSI